ncbi:hypothetical protein [Paenibacillus fonticola]|uniref:hypothetical protein n=1 Tax=Paenibacillus fonticola TaxID=379896 RepID=UPI00036C9D60|nr:hypothetical protein [Paenibacillus fonticola]
MIDLTTGRFVLREGVELFPGMTRKEFFESPLYKTELFHESDKDDLKNYSYFLKTQNIDGFEMSINIVVSSYDYVTRIELTRPDFYNWPDWPTDVTEEDYAYAIKKYNDEFLQHQVQGSIREGNEISFRSSWGSITSSINLRHTPKVMITIRYREVPFLKAKGMTFGHIDIFGNTNHNK